jgi:uncharacterized protein involved in response to NO
MTTFAFQFSPMAKRATKVDFGTEPFRLFFPAGVLAGLLGVALWPLHFGGYVAFYPGQVHARLMAFGFFGAFILGFLGTALPRMPYGHCNAKAHQRATRMKV